MGLSNLFLQRNVIKLFPFLFVCLVVCCISQGRAITEMACCKISPTQGGYSTPAFRYCSGDILEKIPTQEVMLNVYSATRRQGSRKWQSW